MPKAAPTQPVPRPHPPVSQLMEDICSLRCIGFEAGALKREHTQWAGNLVSDEGGKDTEFPGKSGLE